MAVIRPARDDDHVRAAGSAGTIVDGCANIGRVLLIGRRQRVGVSTSQRYCKYQDSYEMRVH